MRLGSRALTILLTLIARPGEVISKAELIAVTWPNTFVDDSNLRVHVSALRKLLGDAAQGGAYISSVSGRGYVFEGNVRRLFAQNPSHPPQAGYRHLLPTTLTRVLGRDDAVAAVVARLASHRFASLIGPGGVGKTTVALTAADRLVDLNRYRACFVDLSVVSDPQLVPVALATRLSVSVLDQDPTADVLEFLRSEQLLIVLDNCEHVLAPTAALVERLLSAAQGISIIVTSRAALSVAAEWTYSLAGLQSPPKGKCATAADALEYPSVRLFVERASAASEAFTFSDADAPLVSELCRRLDGLPLAIELAAGSLDLFGVKALLGDIDDQRLLAARGRRTAQPRHQSLRATWDWSYDGLSPTEKTVLQRLSIFKGDFDIEAAMAVGACGVISAVDAHDAVRALSAKSLLSADVSGAIERYRLLQVTRSYCAEKLKLSPDRAGTSRRHAEYFCGLLRSAEAAWEHKTRVQWLAEYEPAIDDVRAALEWAFSSEGDAEIGASMTVASLPFGFQLSLIDEFKRRVSFALSRLVGASPSRPLAELRLTVALANLNQNTTTDDNATDDLLVRAITIADAIDVARHKIEAYTCKAIFHLEEGEYAQALVTAEELEHIAESADDALAVLASNRVSAQIFHFNGQHERSRTLITKVLDNPVHAIPLAYHQTSVDRRVSMRIVLARILWLQGRAEQAAEVISEGLALAEADGPFACCQALGLAGCAVALWTGEDILAETRIQALIDNAKRFTLTRWLVLGQCYKHALERGRLRRDARQAVGPDPFAIRPTNPFHWDLIASVAKPEIPDAAITRAFTQGAGWCGPEILRVAAEQHDRPSLPDTRSTIEAWLQRSLELSMAQKTIAWELRTATTIARLKLRDGRPSDARAVLAPVVERFKEGHRTADLRAAFTLLQTL